MSCIQFKTRKWLVYFLELYQNKKKVRRHLSDELEKEDTYYGIRNYSCGACAAQCPVEAISEGDDKYVIDADTCVECGACAAQCPVEAIEEA